MPEPLESLQIIVIGEENGAKDTYPALHPKWKDDIKFLLYKPVVSSDPAYIQEWSERISLIVQDLDWLLRQPHHKFWCQVVFDYSLLSCIDSYLKYAPRFYDVRINLPEDVEAQRQTLHRMVFMVCLRMSTHKESKEHFISPEVFGDILYENYIFDIPKLMDLCALYGKDNDALLSKMLTNIFQQQPKYQADLSDTMPTILQVFDNVLMKFGLSSGSAPTSPVRLTESKPTDVAISRMTLQELQDVVYYLTDTAATLRTFLEIYPHAASICHQNSLTARISSFYEKIVPILKKTLKERNFEVPSVREDLCLRIAHARGNLLKIFHQLVFTSCLQVILDTSQTEVMERHVEEYLEIMSSLLSERRFLADYEMLFPFGEDLDLISQLNYQIDERRIEFLKEGIAEACMSFGKSPKRRLQPEGCESNTSQSTNATSPCQASFNEDSTLSNPSNESGHERLDDPVGGACAAQITGVELDSLIMSVKDLLPDLGEGYIQVCLEEFNYDVEKVINAVLEQKLPDSIAGLDTNMKREVAPVIEESLIHQRSNVFDNDDFDIFRRDKIDTSRVILGKKEKTTNSILDDKGAIEDLLPLYQKYGSEDKESMYDKDADYDDEYDDTYDTNQVGADDADSADELSLRRPFTMPRVLSGNNRKAISEEESEEEEESEQQRDQFVQDPAKLRELQAQRAASRFNHRQGAQGQRNRTQQATPQPSGDARKTYDVKGKPKGQGQESDVLRNRAWKEKNKSSRVHHNRKALSDKKKQKGMI